MKTVCILALVVPFFSLGAPRTSEFLNEIKKFDGSYHMIPELTENVLDGKAMPSRGESPKVIQKQVSVQGGFSIQQITLIGKEKSVIRMLFQAGENAESIRVTVINEDPKHSYTVNADLVDGNTVTWDTKDQLYFDQEVQKTRDPKFATDPGTVSWLFDNGQIEVSTSIVLDEATAGKQFAGKTYTAKMVLGKK